MQIRAYDPFTEQMIYDFGIGIPDTTLEYIVGQNDDLTLGIMREGNGEWLSVMLYTGLEDKNGNKIFEGDILSKWLDLAKVYIYCAVVWSDTGCWKLKHNEYYNEPICNVDPCDYMVAGNIYQNPELLEA